MKKTIFSLVENFYKKINDHKIITLTLVICISGGSYYYFSKQTSQTISYQYATVKRGTLLSTISSTGQVISQSQVDLKPKVNANVTNVYVRAGDRVKSGQVLFRLDATDAYKKVRDAKSSLESSKLSLLKLQNPKEIDVMSIENSIKQEEESKKTQNTKVAIAYRNVLTSSLQAFPEGSYTNETAPVITGSYAKATEGQIKINVYQGGQTGYNFSLSGLITGSGQVNTLVAQPLGDTGLYIKWGSVLPQTNWIIDIPNKQSSSYLSNYNAWQDAITNRDTANEASDRSILALKQKLNDLKPGDGNIDIMSAKLQITQKENALLDAQQELSNYTITAPFDGVMASVSVDIGSSAVMASSNSSSALGTIVTDKKMAQATLNETDIVKVKLGQKAKISFDAISDLILEGTVVEINTLGTVTSGVVTYKVKVAFNTDDGRILPNMSTSIDVITDSKDDVLSLSSSAVKKDASGYYVEKDNSQESITEEASSTRHFDTASSSIKYKQASSTQASSTRKIRNSSSGYQNSDAMTQGTTATVTLTRVPVTIGMQSDTQTEIISGLKEGDKVILKKVTTTSKSGTASTPSVASLLRPQGSKNTGAMKP